MKIYIFIILLTALVIVLPAQDANQEPKPLTCNPSVPTEAEVNTPVQFHANAIDTYQPGQLVAEDNIVGIMRFVPATGPEGFLQGSPASEPGHKSDETQFTHILTRNIAVMETEVTRQMWADLKAVQSSLGNDPSASSRCPGMNYPATYMTWTKAVLFANLLSVQNGFTYCYYTDHTKSVPITVHNYTGPVYCDFSANGYRLPLEGEWEYFTRAGTTTTFSIDEPNYNSTTLKTLDESVLPELKKVARFGGGAVASPVGERQANPWGLKGVHGNVCEWCWGLYAPNPSGTVTDYAGHNAGYERMSRGGAYRHEPHYCRSASRYGSQNGVSNYVGIRLVRTL